MRIIQNYLSSGADMSGDSVRRLKFMTINAFTVIGVSFAYIFGVFNILRQFYPLGTLLIFGATLCVINILVLRKTKNIEFAGSVILFLMECLFCSLLIFGSTDRSGLFWFFTFPPLVLFLKNSRQGFAWIGVQFCITIILITLSELRVLPAISYSLYEIVVLCCSLTAVTLIVYFFQLIKNEFIKTEQKRQIDELVEKRRKDQYAIAERIQRMLIPQDDHRFKNIEISGFYQAASGVGGDYFDFFELDGEKIAVIISDVSGKGISGAFVMVNIRSIFQHNITKARIDPAEMVRIINRKLMADSTDDIFATLSVYIFNSTDNMVTFCHAGFGPFIYYSAKKEAVLEFPSFSLPAGVLLEDSNYVNNGLILAPGDIIISFTDGLIESYEIKLEESGKQALYDIVKQNAGKSAPEIKTAILEKISDCIRNKNQHDDISLVVSKIMQVTEQA
ncbi:MAG: SpoIIE family protein phosphatase [Spirochaetales bacterium]|nr:SpoIIE family protein phosphatase [Spirochaetales bacterium]